MEAGLVLPPALAPVPQVGGPHVRSSFPPTLDRQQLPRLPVVVPVDAAPPCVGDLVGVGRFSVALPTAVASPPRRRRSGVLVLLLHRLG